MKLQIQLLLFIVLVVLSGCAAAESQPGTPSSTEEVSTDSTMPVVPVLSRDKFSLEDERIGIVPAILEIPSLSVKTKIEEVGRLDNGQMGVPQDPDQAGWFAPGTKPGARGSAVIAGHVDSLTGPAVFYELEKIKVGDEVLVRGTKGETLRFTVVKKTAYPRTEAPVDTIFGFSYGSGLNLITCTGNFDRKAKTHDERLVVYTELSEKLVSNN